MRNWFPSRNMSALKVAAWLSMAALPGIGIAALGGGTVGALEVEVFLGDSGVVVAERAVAGAGNCVVGDRVEEIRERVAVGFLEGGPTVVGGLAPGSLEVVVRSSEGVVLPGMWVGVRKGWRRDPWPLVPDRGGVLGGSLLAFGRTDAEGRVLLAWRNPPERSRGHMEVAAWGPGRALACRRWDADGGLGSTELRLCAGRDVGVRIQARGGQPVAHAEARLRVGKSCTFSSGCVVDRWRGGSAISDETGLFQGYEQVASVDAMGRVVFPSVPDGVREVRWLAEGCLNEGDLAFAADATELLIVAERGDSLAGRVLDHLGNPLAGVAVQMVQQVETPEPDEALGILGSYVRPARADHWVFHSDASGRFEVHGLEPGNWFYFHFVYGGADFETPWQQDDGGARDHRLPPFHHVSGRLLLPSAPAGRFAELSEEEVAEIWSDAEIEIDRPAHLPEESPIESPSATIRVQADGSFLFVVASGPLHFEIDAGPIWITRLLDIQSDIDLGEIRLLTPPLCSAIGLFPGDSELEEISLSLFCLHQDQIPNGFHPKRQGDEIDSLDAIPGEPFRFEDLAPGQYSLLAEAAGEDGKIYAAYTPRIQISGPDTQLHLEPLQATADLELSLAGFAPWFERDTETTLTLIPVGNPELIPDLSYTQRWIKGKDLSFLSPNQQKHLDQGTSLPFTFHRVPAGTYQLHFHTSRDKHLIHHTSPPIHIQPHKLTTHTWRLPSP